jgi:mono/diheme cytochrome c family protein
MIRSACALVAAAALLACLAMLPREAHAGAAVTLSAAQVASGSKAYAQNCSSCHGAALGGGAGPALTGASFKTATTGGPATVGGLFSYLTKAMPLTAPGSLSHDQYVAILAFILSKNGYKPSAAALTYSAALASKAPVETP